MNERLTELYRLCRPKEALASQDEYKSANALLGSEVEKFAKLLIKECAGIVETESERGTEHTINQILKHFGVDND